MAQISPNPARRNEQSRRAILDAALSMIGEQGYEGTSIEGIADRAGVGKQTIYRWWSSKGAVVLEALEGQVAATTPLSVPDSGNIIEDLRSQMLAAMLVLSSPAFGPAFKAVVAAAQSDPILARANHDRLIESYGAAVRERLETAQRQGQLRSGVDLDTVVDMLFGVFFFRVLLQTRPLDPQQIESALDIAFCGLRPSWLLNDECHVGSMQLSPLSVTSGTMAIPTTAANSMVEQPRPLEPHIAPICDRWSLRGGNDLTWHHRQRFLAA